MTPRKFHSLRDGTKLWFHPVYFAFPMLCVVKTVDGRKGIWVNFYGEGQCFFTPLKSVKKKFYDALSEAYQTENKE